MYIDKLNDIANKYNNAYHRTIIKMRPVDVSSSTYILTLITKITRKISSLKLVIILKY